MSAIPPGGTIGILGSGQLGRMLGMAAAALGYRIHVYAPDSGPACDVAASFSQGGWDDAVALGRFAAGCDVVTYEFENVPVAPLEGVARHVPLRPGTRPLEVAQSRFDEKRFVQALGGTTAPFRLVESEGALAAAIAELGCPAILKTNRMGYDGKGQARIVEPGDAAAAWAAVGGQPSVLEGFVTFAHEFSLLVARGADGETVTYPVPWNEHRGGILHRSSVPAPAEVEAQAGAAVKLAVRVAEALDYVGVLALEFFVTADGPVFNEMAPRVHNSGHWTIEGAETSQFENHVRAICGLPLGVTGLTGARVEMINLIGTDAADWEALLEEPGVHLHLYGKHEARPGRKMGHVTRVWRS
ncbi:5-(carboxyamino)imidazole ribonucleotide synthase [Sphingomonas sp.]|uniref:5-(carboxyamino)imidazole ribonucleotide synthase n=1 Tax=Sphingomonas sp. TaxID=28214 RepID=UPI001B272AD7|nr:5-(carboxyamino)imidazole ribonucleotide synthase [Sphingomonas sp.]MBO9713120.1 5-(carboxyamino)imidazole ribonucleotide synthase [Sphingomonas sp.]